MNNPLSFQVYTLLKLNKININRKELSFQIQSHPTYPSLHAVTGVLNHFKIKNLALEVPVEPEIVDRLPKSFLAQIKEGNQTTFAIIVKEGQTFRMLFDRKRKVSVSKLYFLEQFTGIVLAVDRENSKVEGINLDLKRRATFFSGIAAILLLVSFLIISSISLVNIIYLFLSLIGIYISYEIIKQELGEETTLGEAFCYKPSKNRNCNAVLTSKGAAIFNIFKLSHFSLLYFNATAVCTFLFILSKMDLAPTLLMSLLALPVTIYSIYYQAIILKTWCFLCLIIVGILWLQAFLAVYSIDNSIIDLNNILLFLFCFLTMAVLTLLWLKLLTSNKHLMQVKFKYVKLRKNFELFESQLLKSPKLNSYEKDNQIVFGKNEEPLEIILVTNPLCGHCKSVHELLGKLLSEYSDILKIVIIFNVKANEISNNDTKIAIRLLELYKEGKSKMCLEAMHDIYVNLDVKEWIKKWGFTKNLITYSTNLLEHESWCRDHNINFTPEILINGRVYPKMFERGDLIYHIDDLYRLAKSYSL